MSVFHSPFQTSTVAILCVVFHSPFQTSTVAIAVCCVSQSISE